MNIFVLSDRGVDENHVAIPSLLAVSAMQDYLVRTKKRTKVSVILESGEPREVHHFATLLGFGASAVNPYLALDSIRELIDLGMLNKDYYAAVDDYNKAVLSGIVKIASKMGISTIQSYQGSKIFEAIGIDKSVMDKYFTNTVSRVGGITLKDIENDINAIMTELMTPLDFRRIPPLTVQAAISSEAARRSTSTTLRQSIFSSLPQETEIMLPSRNTPSLSMRSLSQSI